MPVVKEANEIKKYTAVFRDKFKRFFLDRYLSLG